MNKIALIEQRLFDAEDEYHVWPRAEEKKSPSPELNDGEPWVCAVAEVLAVKTQPLRHNLAVVIDRLAAAMFKIQQLEVKLAALENEELKFAGRCDKDRPYSKGSVVNFSGSAWVATSDVRQANCQTIHPIGVCLYNVSVMPPGEIGDDCRDYRAG